MSIHPSIQNRGYELVSISGRSICKNPVVDLEARMRGSMHRQFWILPQEKPQLKGVCEIPLISISIVFARIRIAFWTTKLCSFPSIMISFLAWFSWDVQNVKEKKRCQSKRMKKPSTRGFRCLDHSDRPHHRAGPKQAVLASKQNLERTAVAWGDPHIKALVVSKGPSEQWKKGPWLFSVYRGLYYPVM